MADIIQLLPDHVANQIAAGEVVQRPASVVKELMENAIDAGSSQVQLIIKEAGKLLIQVVDDGKGMSVTDARMAFERHATSKIKSSCPATNFLFPNSNIKDEYSILFNLDAFIIGFSKPENNLFNPVKILTGADTGTLGTK